MNNPIERNNPQNIQDFQKLAAQGGMLQQNKSGKIVASGKGLGRIFAWLRGKLDKKTERANTAATNIAFIKAVSKDKKYGGEVLKRNAKSLGLHPNKPLSAKSVKKALKLLERDVDQVHKNNEQMAERFSEDTAGIETRQNFGTLIKEIPEEKLTPSAKNLLTTFVSKGIKEAILKKGKEGKHEVTVTEASKIAHEQIEKFFQVLTPNEMSEIDERVGSNQISAQNNLVSALKNYHLEKITGRLQEMVVKEAEKKGISEKMALRLNTEKLETSLVYLIHDQENPLSSQEANELASNKIQDFIAAKKKLFDAISDEEFGPQAKEKLTDIVFQEPIMKSQKQYDTMMQFVPNIPAFAKGIKKAQTPGQLLKEIKNLQAKFQEAVDQSGIEGGDDVYAFFDSAAKAWLATQHSLNDEELADIFNKLGNKQAMEVREGLEFLSFDLMLPGGHAFGSTLCALIDGVLGDHLKIDDEKIAEMQRTPQTFKKLEDLPDALIKSARDADPNIALPNPIGRSGKDFFGEEFNTQYEESLNNEFEKTNYRYKDDLCEEMSRDFGRADFAIGGSSEPSENPEQALRAFFEDDPAGLHAVSTVTHQGLSAQILISLTQKQGPFQGMLTFPNETTVSRYEINRSDTGFRISYTFNGNPSSILDPEGAHLMLDPKQSRFNTSLEFEISNASIQEGKPEAKLLHGIEYDYHFVPAQE